MQSFRHKFPHVTWAVSLSRWQTSEQFHRKMQLHRFCSAHLKGSDIKCPSCPCVMAQQLMLVQHQPARRETYHPTACLSRETLQFWMTTAKQPARTNKAIFCALGTGPSKPSAVSHGSYRIQLRCCIPCRYSDGLVHTGSTYKAWLVWSSASCE